MSIWPVKFLNLVASDISRTTAVWETGSWVIWMDHGWELVLPQTFGRKLKTSMVGRGPLREGKACCLVVVLLDFLSKAAHWGWDNLEVCDTGSCSLGWHPPGGTLSRAPRVKERFHGTSGALLSPRPNRWLFLRGSECDVQPWPRRGRRTREVFWTSLTVLFSLSDGTAAALETSSPDVFQVGSVVSDAGGWSGGNGVAWGGFGMAGSLCGGLDRLMGAPSTSRFTPT